MDGAGNQDTAEGLYEEKSSSPNPLSDWGTRLLSQ